MSPSPNIAAVQWTSAPHPSECKRDLDTQVQPPQGPLNTRLAYAVCVAATCGSYPPRLNGLGGDFHSPGLFFDSSRRNSFPRGKNPVGKCDDPTLATGKTVGSGQNMGENTQRMNQVTRRMSGHNERASGQTPADELGREDNVSSRTTNRESRIKGNRRCQREQRAVKPFPKGRCISWQKAGGRTEWVAVCLRGKIDHWADRPAAPRTRQAGLWGVGRRSSRLDSP